MSAYQLVVTYALLFPLIFLAVRGAFSFHYTASNNATGSDFVSLNNPETGQGSAVHSAEMLLCYGLICMAMIPLWRQLSETCLQNKLAFALPIWAVMSALWSQEPKRSALFGLIALLNTIFALYLPTRFNPKQQMQLFALLGLVMTVGSLLLAGVMPGAGIDHKNSMIGLEGLYPHKNICSVTTIMLMLPAFFYRFKGQSAALKKAAYLGIGLALVIATTSRTGWLTLIAVLGFIYTVKSLRRIKKFDRLIVLWFVPGALLSIAWLIFTYKSQLLALMGKDPTLSGRTVIWQAVFSSIWKSPWLGYGYDAFWTGKGESLRLAMYAGDPALGNAENGVLQVWLELGLVGVAILFIFLFRACLHAIRCFRANTPDHAIWYMTLVFMSVLSIILGDKFMARHAINWTMLILADAGLAMEARRVRNAQVA